MAQVKKVFSRVIANEGISMWGSPHADPMTGDMAGWLVDTWTERGELPILNPKLHCVSKEDGKIFHVQLDIGYHGSSIQIHQEDMEIDPKRVAFIRKTLEVWEREYSEGKKREASA